jgi:hypothetical protein
MAVKPNLYHDAILSKIIVKTSHFHLLFILPNWFERWTTAQVLLGSPSELP